MKVTSAYANKMLKKLQEEKDYWVNREKESMLYTVAMDEEPVIPDYDWIRLIEEYARSSMQLIRLMLIQQLRYLMKRIL